MAEDVKSAEYKEEKKLWNRTNDDPEAYALGTSWGLVRVEELDKWIWKLFMILSPTYMRELDSVMGTEDDEPPFLWARSKLVDWEEKRKTAEWDERTIGSRKPGEEGVHGGNPIPMQTIDVKKKKREAARKAAREQETSGGK